MRGGLTARSAAWRAGASGWGSAAIVNACSANALTMSKRLPTPVRTTAVRFASLSRPARSVIGGGAVGRGEVCGAQAEPERLQREHLGGRHVAEVHVGAVALDEPHLLVLL